MESALTPKFSIDEMRLIWGRKTPEKSIQNQTMGKVEQNVEERNTKYMAQTKREELIPRNSSIQVDKSQWKIRKVAKKRKWSEVRKNWRNFRRRKQEQKFIILIQSECGKEEEEKKMWKVACLRTCQGDRDRRFDPSRIILCQSGFDVKRQHKPAHTEGWRWVVVVIFVDWLVVVRFGRLGLRLVISAVIFLIYFL